MHPMWSSFRLRYCPDFRSLGSSEVGTAPAITAIDHGNNQIRCIQRNGRRGTPLSLPGTLEKERRCPNHSIRNSCCKNPGKCNSVATYQGTNSTTKINI